MRFLGGGLNKTPNKLFCKFCQHRVRCWLETCRDTLRPQGSVGVAWRNLRGIILKNKRISISLIWNWNFKEIKTFSEKLICKMTHIVSNDVESIVFCHRWSKCASLASGGDAKASRLFKGTSSEFLTAGFSCSIYYNVVVWRGKTSAIQVHYNWQGTETPRMSFSEKKKKTWRSSGQIDCRRTKKASFFSCGAKRPSHWPRMIQCQLQLIKALSGLARAAQTCCVGGKTRSAAVKKETFLLVVSFMIHCFGFAASHKSLITDFAMSPIAELIWDFNKKKNK